MIKLYNSLTKTVGEFKPLLAGQVRLYSCGPTVYDHAHIGNLSAFIYVDTLRRLLAFSGYSVHHVMNITDVDDKTIKRSQTEYPEDSAETAIKNLTSVYEASFKNDIASIGIETDKFEFIKATDSIAIMQQLIRRLYEHKFAYIADDGIYFSIEAYERSGKKYGQLVEIDTSNTSQARINNDEYDKQSAHDFALWKFMQPNEPAWSFEIDGKDYLGRPGWHIECSAMSTDALGQPFDIHTGGVDLMFPHHENEIAQSTADQDSPAYSEVFLHNEHILVDNQKMSKSLGNSYTLDDILEHSFQPLAFRLLVLQSHYRKQADFTWEILDSAQKRLTELKNISALRFQTVDKGPETQLFDFNSAFNKLVEDLSDDLNTPKALSRLSETMSEIETKLVSNSELNDHGFIEYFDKIDQLFGLDLSHVADIGQAAKDKIMDREAARKNQNFADSDRLRDELRQQNIGLRDTSFGPIWYWLN